MDKYRDPYDEEWDEREYDQMVENELIKKYTHAVQRENKR